MEFFYSDIFIYFIFNLSVFQTLPEAKYLFPFVCGNKYLFHFLKTFLSINLDAKLGVVLIFRCALLHTFKVQSIKIALAAIKLMLRSLYNYLFYI